MSVFREVLRSRSAFSLFALVVSSVLSFACRDEKPEPVVPPVVPPVPPPSVFAIIGDYGDAGPNEERVANLVKTWRPGYIVTTGDNNYPDGAAATIKRRSLPDGSPSGTAFLPF